MRHPRCPVAAEARAPDSDAGAVDVSAPRQMIDPGRIGALGVGVAIEHGILAGARHVHGQGGEPGAMGHRALALAVLLPAVDAAPMHDDRWPRDAARDLQIANELLAVERDLDDLQRRLEVLRLLAEIAHRMPVGLDLTGRAGDRIAADAAIFERHGVDLGEFLAGCALLRALVAPRLVRKPDLTPGLRPLIAVEARERL